MEYLSDWKILTQTLHYKKAKQENNKFKNSHAIHMHTCIKKGKILWTKFWTDYYIFLTGPYWVHFF